MKALTRIFLLIVVRTSLLNFFGCKSGPDKEKAQQKLDSLLAGVKRR